MLQIMAISSREYYYMNCSGSVVVTAYDFESRNPGSNPESIYYEASITAQGLLKRLHPTRVVHWIPEQLNIKAVTGACK